MNKNSFEEIPHWHDSVASQLVVEQQKGIVKWLGNIASKMYSSTRQRFEDKMEYNLAVPTHSSTVAEIEEFERVHINPLDIINVQAPEHTSRPQSSISECDVA